MHIYRYRPIKSRRGIHPPTTEEQVRAALADPARRVEIIRQTNKTVSAMRTLIGRDPREMAYVVVAIDTEKEYAAISSHLDLRNLIEWVSAARDIVGTYPQVRAFVERERRQESYALPHAQTEGERDE